MCIRDRRCCVVSAILESSTDVATYLLTFLHRSVELDAFSGLERSSGEIGQSLCMTTAHYRTTETALWLRSLIFGRRVSCVLDPFPPPPPRVGLPPAWRTLAVGGRRRNFLRGSLPVKRS